ncbi:hypothetical protein WR25_24432 isoform A [Diploscapter pachys]|uniref:Uncharacterized protein n=2 Tax=Diploscapter pachys TaxID=2018661 RepID=A0A2A2LJ80_9BILA|nr:hypothetical protein WR25_24432 isoform A [Diploscapter pachys]
MLSHHDVPHLLKRSHVVSGYRPLHQPRHFYIRSAFRAHNEVMNVWTHFVPAILLFIFYLYPEWLSDRPRPAVLLLHVGIILLLFASSMAHLMHSRSEMDHIFWFLVDFGGIALFGIAIGAQRYSCAERMETFIHLTYLPLLMLIVLGLQFFSSSYLFVFLPLWKRRLELRMLSCLVLAFWLNIPLMNPNAEEDVSLRLHSRSFQWLLISGIFMGAQVPERFAPGVFDIFGYGHQLFHLCVNMVAWNLADAADLDCSADWHWTPRLVASLVTFVTSILFIAFIIHQMVKTASKRKYE